jgi:hypothetical protein
MWFQMVSSFYTPRNQLEFQQSAVWPHAQSKAIQVVDVAQFGRHLSEILQSRAITLVWWKLLRSPLKTSGFLAPRCLTQFVRAIKQFSSGALSSFAQQQQKIWEFLKWAGTFIVCVPSEKV